MRVDQATKKDSVYLRIKGKGFIFYRWTTGSGMEFSENMQREMVIVDQEKCVNHKAYCFSTVTKATYGCPFIRFSRNKKGR